MDRPGHIRPAYASTVHKAQGSEYDRVVLALVRNTHPNMIYREMVYTAVTRARRSLRAIGHTAWLERLEPVERRTLLPHLDARRACSASCAASPAVTPAAHVDGESGT